MKFTEADIARALEKGILTEYEASLIERIDLRGGGVTQVAGEDNKSKGTVSLQHTTAIRKFSAFLEEERRIQSGGQLAADVFKLLDAGTPVTRIVSRLRVDPDEAERLYKAWVKLKSQDLNQSSIPAAIVDLEKRLAALEAKVEAGESGEDSGLVDYGSLWGYLDGYLSDLNRRVDELEDK